ncbi:hypothetical protein IV60_GL000793 [Lancefieldella rimae]|uniref:Uncharacterized protein n=2 Tax=Lancefieldella rimae TaxID=1383 RepID=B9CM60_LANR4|nr:hypothetical protein ATORI0001_1399 [Lancefieldella rimae ATCC 49626]KRO02361.1 hypothetical protein IV60_GL000793 [Lancefieldella rimae]
MLYLAPRNELLQDIRDIHCLECEVVGDAVQGEGDLVLLVSPLIGLAIEIVRAC